MTLLPCDLDAERAVLGAILLDNSALEKIDLDQTDFYDPRHRKIFQAILSLSGHSIAIDLVTVKGQLNPEELETITPSYLVTLTDGLPRALNVPAYANSIKRKARERRLVFTANNLAQAALNGNGDLSGALPELTRALEAYDHDTSSISLPDWQLWESANFHSWPGDELEWHVENILPKGGIGFISAPPKSYKSFMMLDLSLHMAQENPTFWLGKYQAFPSKVLYIAREDPLRRIRDRMVEICDSTPLKIPEPGRLSFLVRDRISLTDPAHLDWLKHTITSTKSTICVLDVLNRMVPGLDELSAKDMADMVTLLEELNRELGVTICAVDHTRKPQGDNRGRDTQEPNPFDLKGSIAKYGCADFMICLARTPQLGRIMCYVENKDTELHPMFLVDVSPLNSGKPKFTFAGDVEKMIIDQKAIGEANRERILASLTDQWVSPKKLSSDLNLSPATITKHLSALLASQKIEKRGNSRAIEYRIQFNCPDDVSKGNSRNLFDGNN